MIINNTMINENLVLDNYDRNGEIIYTTVVILFYSLSLFCLLILSFDPDDHYHEKKRNVYRNSRTTKTHHSSQMDILNILSNEELRQKYWRIYYGDKEYEYRSKDFHSAESKRLSYVSQLVIDLKNEKRKQKSKHRELDELNQITSNSSLQTPPAQPTPSFLSKFRRSRSTSVPGVMLADESIENRSYDALCLTPLCKPPLITITKYH
ncbi:hypothetical protein I4U23_003331 [Adineta vaga]|nr:hypothetical protein I4U23_003331 [Adineta vaga]